MASNNEKRLFSFITNFSSSDKHLTRTISCYIQKVCFYIWTRLLYNNVFLNNWSSKTKKVAKSIPAIYVNMKSNVLLHYQDIENLHKDSKHVKCRFTNDNDYWFSRFNVNWTCAMVFIMPSGMFMLVDLIFYTLLRSIRLIFRY